MRKNHTILLSLVVVSLSACGGELADQGEDDSLVGEALNALEGSNALNLNALNLNALNLNALNLNALNLNSLSPSALSTLQSAGANGDLARQLLRYAVSCALDSTQSFSFTWTDSMGLPHAEVYWGALGLKTSWHGQALSTAGERWVSACLASRVNWYGVPVLISSRGPNDTIDHTGFLERTLYPRVEGAFWGNLFGTTPALYSCHHASNAANSRALLRDCAAGHVDSGGSLQSCGIIQRVGECDEICDEPVTSGQYYPSCDAGGGEDGKIVTVFLP